MKALSVPLIIAVVLGLPILTHVLTGSTMLASSSLGGGLVLGVLGIGVIFEKGESNG